MLLRSNRLAALAGGLILLAKLDKDAFARAPAILLILTPIPKGSSLLSMSYNDTSVDSGRVSTTCPAAPVAEAEVEANGSAAAF